MTITYNEQTGKTVITLDNIIELQKAVASCLSGAHVQPYLLELLAVAISTTPLNELQSQLDKHTQISGHKCLDEFQHALVFAMKEQHELIKTNKQTTAQEYHYDHLT